MKAARVPRLVVLLTLLMAATATAADAPAPRWLPIPSGKDLARAEKDVADLFDREIAAAKMPADKSSLGVKMLETAVKAGDDAAGRYVLARQARDLAVAGNDPPTALRAVEMLVAYEPANPAEGDNERIARGHELWKKAEQFTGRTQLDKRMEAAECYVRSLPSLTGLARTLAETRLGELGWNASGIAGGQGLPSGWFRIVNRNSGLALSIREGSRAAKADVLPWNTPAESRGSPWRLERDAGGYRLENQNSTLFMTVVNGSKNAGVGICQMPKIRGSLAQRWAVEPVEGGFWKFINANSGQALAIPGGSKNRGDVACQWPYANRVPQQWRLEPVP